MGRYFRRMMWKVFWYSIPLLMFMPLYFNTDIFELTGSTIEEIKSSLNSPEIANFTNILLSPMWVLLVFGSLYILFKGLEAVHGVYNDVFLSDDGDDDDDDDLPNSAVKVFEKYEPEETTELSSYKTRTRIVKYKDENGIFRER